ncbi:MAG TPA: hypothetical protein DCL48_09505 [Alphaproteobacteria bacterium]|nr:hypothetical protein [Alphaproteobacteria bacterium]
MADAKSRQRDLISEVILLIAAYDGTKAKLSERSAEELIVPVADAARSSILQNFAEIRQTLASPLFEKKFKVNKQSSLATAMSRQFLMQWYSGEKKMQPKTFAFFVLVMLFWLAGQSKPEVALRKFVQACRKFHGTFRLSAEQFEALVHPAALSHFLGEAAGSGDRQAQSEAVDQQPDRSITRLLIPSTHSLSELIEFERANAGLYHCYRRHSSHGRKMILRETMLLRRQLRSRNSPQGPTSQSVLDGLAGDYIGIMPMSKPLYEHWSMQGMVTHSDVTFHLWRHSKEARYLHETLVFPRLRRATFDTSVGMLTGLTDGGDQLCTVPVIIHRQDVSHNLPQPALLANMEAHAVVLAQDDPLYLLLRPIFYHSDLADGPVVDSAYHYGPGLLSLDPGIIRDRFIEAVQSLRT